jgi:hypothetical protein
MVRADAGLAVGSQVGLDAVIDLGPRHGLHVTGQFRELLSQAQQHPRRHLRLAARAARGMPVLSAHDDLRVYGCIT